MDWTLYSNSGLLVKIVGAITVLIAGFILGRLASNLILRVLEEELKLDKTLKKQGIKIPISKFLASFVRFLIYFAALIMSLNVLGLTTTVLQIILIIILIVIIIILLLAFKDFVPNITAGFLLHKKGDLKKGNKIKVNSISGKIIELGVLETKLKTSKGDIVFIPNSVLNKNKIIKLKK